MARPTHVTALLIAAAAPRGSTADLYRTDRGSGSVIRRAVRSSSGWPVDAVVLVLGDDAEALLEDVSEPVEVLIDPEWEEGPAAGLRAGFDLVVREERSDAVLVVWLDRVLPDGEVVAAVIERAGTAERPIVAAKYRYAVDHPMLVRELLWGRVLGMEGAATLDALVATHPEWLAEVWVDSVPPRRFESVDDLGGRR